MTIVTLSASGRLTPEEAWHRYMDLSLWSDWAPQVKRVEATDGKLTLGLTGRVYGPAGVHVDFIVDGVDEVARRWSWTVRRGPISARLEHAVRRKGGGCAATIRLDGPLPIVVGYAPMAQFALHCLVSKQPRPTLPDGTIPEMYVDPTDPAQVAKADPDATRQAATDH